MKKFIGIGKEKGDKWYTVNIYLYSVMLKLTLYSYRYKKPNFFFYDKEEFSFCLENNIIIFDWFIGISLR